MSWAVVASWEGEVMAVHGPFASKADAHVRAIRFARNTQADAFGEDSIYTEYTDQSGAQIEGDGIYAEYDVLELTEPS